MRHPAAAMADASFDEITGTERAPGEPALHVDVDGYEGPLDLLLDLARRQKVDLHAISILALAEQYLAFVAEARRLRLELAADYLVMAAWLAYLKSRLLLPEPPKAEEASAADLATALAQRLQRLETIREAARHLAGRDQLGRAVFPRGGSEPAGGQAPPSWEATLYDLLSAYAERRQKRIAARVTLRRRAVWSLVEARAALERLVGACPDWTTLDRFLLDYLSDPAQRSTVLASAFSATLEMAREGRIAIRQDGVFAPIWVRAAASAETASQS